MPGHVCVNVKFYVRNSIYVHIKLICVDYS